MRVLTKIKYLHEGSEKSNNLGLTPLKARYDKHYLETITGEESITTDLDERKHRKTNGLSQFMEIYVGLYFEESSVTILSAVVDANIYPKLTDFIKNFRRRLERRNIELLGYIWQRDVGGTLYKHYHLLIATKRMNEALIKELIDLGNMNKEKFSFQTLKTKGGMRDYLEKKELYAAPKERCWSRSNKFKKP
jgi:hypothetical protein